MPYRRRTRTHDNHHPHGTTADDGRRTRPACELFARLRCVRSFNGKAVAFVTCSNSYGKKVLVTINKRIASEDSIVQDGMRCVLWDMTVPAEADWPLF